LVLNVRWQTTRLSEFLRSVFYEDWMPHQVSGRYDAPWLMGLFSDFHAIFARPTSSLPVRLGALNGCSRSGQLDHVSVQLAAGVRRELEGKASVPESAEAGDPADRSRLG
jgi:hypothetical protein